MAKNITIMTFGYGFGGPGEGFAFVANVRNVPSFKTNTPDRTGQEKEVRDEIMATSQAKAWLKKMKGWGIEDGDKVAIGCARGHHRSVAIAHDYAAWLKSEGWTVTVNHRDIKRSYTWEQALVNKVLS